MDIVCIIGSLRTRSLNRAVFNTLVDVSDDLVSIAEASIGDLPLYNADLEAKSLPETVRVLKEKIEAADGVIIITPEYNRSVPGVLKNAIDWASRPNGGSSWNGKPAVVIGATDGSLGTAAAQMHLKGIFTHMGSRQMGTPEFYLGHASSVLNTEGTLIEDEVTRKRLKKLLEAFITHIKK